MANGHGGSRLGVKGRMQAAAINDLERIGANPIEMMFAVYNRALDAYDKARGYSDKTDAGAAYLSVAGQMAANLAKYKHPTFTAIAIKDLDGGNDSKRPITTEEAMKIIQGDPFAPKAISNDQVLEAMKSGIKTPALPIGSENE